ncbi:MAG: protoporphyrinogen/coproporphyrinogen oxidase, partial [Propionibacteriaceae bacterium]
TVRDLQVESGGCRLRTGPVPAPTGLHVDAVVLATPARATARLLAAPAPAAADRLDGIAYASMAVVSLLVRGADLVGSGLLVPPGELPTVKALTHSDRKWQWLADAVAEEHGPDVHVVRASIGRAGEERLLQLSDDALVRRTVAELATLPGWAGASLLEGRVQRWGGGLPQYAVGHRERIAEVRQVIAGLPGLAVCGAAYDGVGIAACVAGAEQAAGTIIDFLHTGTEERHRP